MVALAAVGLLLKYVPPMNRLAFVLTVLTLAIPRGAAAQDDVMQGLVGRQQKPFIDPAGFFAVVIPGGFDCQAAARKVTCGGTRGVQALLTIEVVDVPASATVELVMLNQADAFKRKPHYQQVAKRSFKMDGTKALLASFTFDHNGNVELAVGVQALYMVKNTKAYVIHYEGRADQMVVHKADLEQLYASFKTARLDGGGNPIVEDLKPRAVKNSDLPDVERALKGGF
jgi:hypothetical protein